MKKVLALLTISILFFGCKKDKGDPDIIRIRSVEVVSFPNFDDGERWDVGSDADVSFDIRDLDENKLYDHDTYVVDATSGDLVYFYLESGYPLPNSKDSFYIFLWDYDSTSANDFIGYVSFSKGDFADEPTLVTLERGDITIIIELEYQWN